MKRYPEIALAIKEDTELADCIWNGVEEVSHRGSDFLSSRSSKEQNVYFGSTFGGMCINHMHYFQLTLNHFIRAVLIDLIKTNFREYSKSDFIVWATSLYQFAHLESCNHSSEHYWAFLQLLAPINFFRTGIKTHDQYLLYPVRSYKQKLSKQGKFLLHSTHVADSIHGSTEAYTFLSIRGKFMLSSNLKAQYLCEDTDISELFKQFKPNQWFDF